METLTGKQGNLVFFNRLGQSLIRVYVKPKDPKTSAQILQRSSFRFINKLWRYMPSDPFLNIWKLQSSLHYPVNNFIKSNFIVQNPELDFNNIILTAGELEEVNAITFIKYSAAAKRASFEWSVSTSGNGQASDQILLTLIDFANYRPTDNLYNLDFYIDTSNIRSNAIGAIDTNEPCNCSTLWGFVSTFTSPIIQQSDISYSKNSSVTVL